MSSPHRTLSPHEHCLAKTKAPGECTEEEWQLISEGELNPMSSNNKNTVKMQDWEKRWRVEVQKDKHQWRQDEAEKRAQEEAKHLACEEAAKKVQEEEEQKAQEEAKRRAEEECKVQEVAVRAKEKAEKVAKEATVREEAVKRVAEAVEERADTERRAVEEWLWEAAGQQSATMVAPLQVAKPSGQMTVAGPSTPGCRLLGCRTPAPGATTRAPLVSSALPKAKPWHVRPVIMQRGTLGALGALTTMLDTLSMDFLNFQQDSWNLRVAMLRVIEAITNELQRVNDLKEEEMGKSKGKGKEREEGPRQGRTETQRWVEQALLL
ncbi:hypothetical protein ID866_11280 [Astraeus odoratus]|nr:hypothetical protein ID866_11280 [Astraeus odoratus]